MVEVRAETEEGPTLIELVQELRRELGLFDGAMPISPKAAWEEALDLVCVLRGGGCYRCYDRYGWNRPTTEVTHDG